MLKKLDIFGKRVNLRFQGEDEYRTVCGALATLIMILILGVLSYLSARDILKGKIDQLGYMINNHHPSYVYQSSKIPLEEVHKRIATDSTNSNLENILTQDRTLE